MHEQISTMLGTIDSKCVLTNPRSVQRPEIEFYDTEKDPFELNDLAKNPDYADDQAFRRS